MTVAKTLPVDLIDSLLSGYSGMMQRRPVISSIEEIAVASVRLAASAALTRMGIKVDSTEKTESGELIKASTASRRIEIELDSITASTTRMRATAKNAAPLYDSPTATEIILQTEKLI